MSGTNLEEVRFAAMQKGGTPVFDGNVGDVWRSPVRLESNETITAFVKLAAPRELFIECACAVIGRRLGLKIPSPIIVKPLADCFGNEMAEGQLAFGSQDARAPSFLRQLRSARFTTSKLYKALEGSGHSLNAGVFDEWIANSDRHDGNILYGGGDDIYFIDHALAIPQGVNSGSPASNNQIVEEVYVPKSDPEKFRVKRECKASILQKFELIPLATVSEKVSGSKYLAEKDIEEVINFLRDRLPQLYSLFKDRLQIKQKEMKLVVSEK